MAGRFWSEEEKKWLGGKVNGEKIHPFDLESAFQEKFGFFRSKEGLYSQAKSLGFAYDKTQTKKQGEFTARRQVVVNTPQPETDIGSQILKLLQQEPRTMGDLSLICDRSKKTIRQELDHLKTEGFEIALDPALKKVTLRQFAKTEFETIPIKEFKRKTVRLLLVSDTQLGSKYQQLSLLKTAYEIGTDADCDFAVHAGDVVDGRGMYRGQDQEIFLHGADEQRDYTLEFYPRLGKTGKPRKTYFIAGSHDLSFLKIAGYNILKDMAERREDFLYAGEHAGQFRIFNDKALVRMWHPSGGVPYARSYRIQKFIEALQGKFKEIPDIVVGGHLHISGYFPYLQIHGFLSGCFQTQTTYLAAKGLCPEVGFWIVEINLDSEDHINRIDQKWYDLNSRVKSHDY